MRATFNLVSICPKSFTTTLRAPLCLLLPLILTFSAHAGPLDDAVGRIENKVNNINGNLNTVRSNISNLPETIQSNLGVTFDGDAKARALEVFDNARDVFEEERINLEAFGDGAPGTGCFDFRGSLKTLTGKIGEVTNTLLSLGKPAGSAMVLDVADRVNLIDQIPCKALLIPSLAFNKTPLSGVTADLEKTANEIQSLEFLYAPEPAQASSALATSLSGNVTHVSNISPLVSLPPKCDVVLERRLLLRTIATDWAARSLALNAVGAYVDPDELKGGGPIALKQKQGEKIIGVHGYGSFTLKAPENDKRAAGGLKFVGKVLGTMSDFVFKKVRHCEVISGQQSLLEELCASRRFRGTRCATLLP